MTATLRTNLVQADWIARDGGFVRVARFNADMDFVLYLNSDCSYRADRVDAFLTLLWAPTEDRLVGIKLKGFRFLFQRIRALLELKDDDFVPMVKALELTLVGGMAESLMDKAASKRLQERYEQAKTFATAENLSVSPTEWRKAA